MGRNRVCAVALGVTLAGCATARDVRSRVVRAPDPCVDQTVQIYFDPRSAELTPEGRAVIHAAATGARACAVRAVQVLGLADAAGAPDANLELSRKRADAVSAALAADGLPAAEFQVAAAGAAGAITASGAANPLRRRVDITLKLARR